MEGSWLDYRAWRKGAENTVRGKLLVWPQLAAPQLGDRRDVLVYLPPSLAETGPDGSRRYPVLYFQDGQNVFDEHTSYVGEWRADETLELLAGEGMEAIAVAIPNGREARMDEYNPWRDDRRRMGGRGDAYLGWLVGHVKPLVDGSFPTAAAPELTGIVGSSMGGLISLYALAAYPHVFGLGGILSPSLGWSNGRILELVESGFLPRARIYLDGGGREWKGMLPGIRRLRGVLLERGFVEGRDLRYVEERHGTHNESAWGRRLPEALRFLLSEAGS